MIVRFLCPSDSVCCPFVLTAAGESQVTGTRHQSSVASRCLLMPVSFSQSQLGRANFAVTVQIFLVDKAKLKKNSNTTGDGILLTIYSEGFGAKTKAEMDCQDRCWRGIDARNT